MLNDIPRQQDMDAVPHRMEKDLLGELDVPASAY